MINDGKDPKTAALFKETNYPFPVTYREIEHPAEGFGLCIARNEGMKVAEGKYVCYLDDDNQLRPNFVEKILSFLEKHPYADACLPQQWRRRDVTEAGIIIRQGKAFIAPKAGTTIEELVTQKELFDSNGFIHRRNGAPAWNAEYRIYCDYEYLLQWLSQGKDITLLPEVLVDYVQTSAGEIARSSYRQWASELQTIYAELNQYLVLRDRNAQTWLPKKIQAYLAKADSSIPAFRR